MTTPINPLATITTVRLSEIPLYFSSNNFQVYDNVDNTKGVEFQTSGITSSVFRCVSSFH